MALWIDDDFAAQVLGSVEQGKKIVTVLLVLGVGLGAAMFFRKDHTDPAVEHAAAKPALPRRSDSEETRADLKQAATLPATPSLGGPQASAGVSPQHSPAATPVEPGAGSPPPAMPNRYQAPPRQAPSTPSAPSTLAPWPESSYTQSRPYAPPARKQTHKVVDGDSLEKLAERYLGSAERHAEIFAANRDVLQAPDLLPIGATLEIPPREQDVLAENPSSRLVPIPPGALQRRSSPADGR